MFATTLQRLARRSALGAGGVLCLLVGAGFLTFAAWLSLTLAIGAIWSSLLMGSVYAGVGAIALALAQRRRPVAPPAPPPPPARLTTAEVIAAFSRGLAEGLATRRR